MSKGAFVYNDYCRPAFHGFFGCKESRYPSTDDQHIRFVYGVWSFHSGGSDANLYIGGYMRLLSSFRLAAGKQTGHRQCSSGTGNRS